jgi:hypothetical protein
MTDAMTAASADVANYENYNGVIAILYSPFLRGQSAGAYTFTINGTQFKIQTINQSSTTGFGRFTHEIGHWIRLPDQYDPVTASGRGYWTTMDGANDREYATWEKDYGLEWIVNPDNIKFLQRPAPGSPDLNVTYKILPTEVADSAADTYTALKIKSSDTVHYYVEGRDKIGANVSDASAANHVVVMEAVDSWPPGIYPKRTLNGQKVLASGDPAHKPDPTVEIAFTGVNAGPPETYNVNVKIKAEEQPDPSITPWGAPPWETTDIWIDSEREGGGWDDPATAAPKPANGESAWVNHVNRVFAKITNKGAAEAKDVQVRFRVNTPGGIGDAGQFVDLPNPAKISIPAGGSKNVYAEWTPTIGEHTCIKAEIEHIPGEKDIFNNFAQENITEFYTGTGSPWRPVRFPVRVANPFDKQQKVYLEIKGLVQDWTAMFDHKWVVLEPKGIKTVYVTITPPANASVCTKRKLDVYGLTQIDDYIQIYGGMNPVIHLANPIEFLRFKVNEDMEKSSPKGMIYRIQGITRPELKNVEIAVIMTDENGRHKIVFTKTDSTGFFRGTFMPDAPGIWTAQPYYAGDDCNAPTEGKPAAIHVPLEKGKIAGSPYLIGMYDLRNEANTLLHLVNTRGEYVRALILFFDDKEKPLRCISEKLSPNDLLEMDVRRLKLSSKIGVVKVLTFVGNELAPGMAGFQRHLSERRGMTESNMETGPYKITDEDQKIIRGMCK